MFVFGVLIALGATAIAWIFIKKSSLDSNYLEKFFGVLLILSLITFLISLSNHSTPYYKEIDPFVDPCYSPISYKHSFGLITLHLMSVVSLLVLYFKGYNLPPLQLTTFIMILCFGILVDAQFLYHISSHDTSRIYFWKDGDYASLYISIYPVLLILCSVGTLLKFIKNSSQVFLHKTYKNHQLNWLSNKLTKAQNLPLLSILLTAPFLLLIIIILTLLGQDIESLNKVYSETATWKLSHQLHPPTVDDRHGHYLCTVAAYGNPKIVKPLGIGRRNGNLIIVNRQLQIANAFECLIENTIPKIHKVIRYNYDRYGVNLAKRINNKNLSNLTYIMMKPVEWTFLIFLYSFYNNPEEVIQNQYK